MAARWGSFLSQAVAGVEARLDTILADDDNSARQGEAKPSLSPSPAAATPPKQSPAPSRTASTNRTNDRLQERLARAIAAKAAGQKADASSSRPSMSTQGSPRQSMDAPSRASSEIADRSSPVTKIATPSPRGSLEIARKSQDAAVEERAATPVLTNGEKEKEVESKEMVNDEGQRGSVDFVPPVANDADSVPVTEARASLDVTAGADNQPTTATGLEDEGQVKGLTSTSEDAQLQHQQEIHGYVERIDALEAKLQYLARETSDAARKAALAAPAGSVEKKLAEKDQQIAQLMEEGKNLASTEQKHRTILKKFRAKIAEDEKELNDLKAAKEKADKDAENLRRRARRADELEKSQGDLHKRVDQLQRELSTLRPEVSTKDSTIADLRTQLRKAQEQADGMTAKINNQAREQDRRRIAELEEAVAALQVEKKLVADRAKAQVSDLREKAERAAERSRALELELKAEVQVMESKLEAMRVRAEEASSGATGDSQAKLLRQVETLQSQYSIASENWQGIETTLRARIANLEKERDEALQRESDMRKKAREAGMRAKRHEEELEETRTKLPNIQQDVKSYQTQLDSLRKRAEEAEAALIEARADFERQKQSWKAEREDKNSQPTPTDRRSWLEDLPGIPFLKNSDNSRPASPQLSMPQRTFSSDLLGLQGLMASKARKTSATPSTTNSDAGAAAAAVEGSRGGGFVRRPSAQPLTTNHHRPSMQSGSGSFFSPTSTIPDLATPLSQHPLDREREQQRERDDNFEGVETSSSPQQILQDMVSVSTVAAGPSVQLVERMSAAIRRLESEKVAAREELARISKQRDEARAEIVALMRDVENNKSALKRVAELEAEVADVNARYETTLEMLGEKSELVEELRADVEDVKAMYRDLVERTIK
ncbi:TATA element modulatory factor [Diplogelasinospora grovesii]|uniref:TATA element modulatory factor n=1 Tax=Diplogelasinospora grovesii TaxID=303347 RepID=A0AAN6MZD2_9PEZI|nr:TATA element modulatory factor [Diplogelasinospora grovesii]